MQLAEGLYSYVWQGQGNNCNTYAIKYVVDGSPEYALIDPGHTSVLTPDFDYRMGRVKGYHEEDALKGLVSELGKDGIKVSDLGLVIFTHCHPDHCLAGLELAHASGARITFHELEMPIFKRVTGGSSEQSWEKKLPASQNGNELPDFFLKEGELSLGKPAGVVLDVIHIPGHSPGSIGLYWKDKKALFAGDVVFYRNTGRYDLPGGSGSVLRESIVKLSRLDVEYLLTGHPYDHPGVITGKKEVEANFSFILTRVLPQGF